MTPAEAAEVLRKYNEWRRWDSDEESPPMPNTTTIGEAIDIAIAALEKTNAPQ